MVHQAQDPRVAGYDALVSGLERIASAEALEGLLACARDLAPASDGTTSPFDLGEATQQARALLNLCAHRSTFSATRSFWYRLFSDAPRSTKRCAALYLVHVQRDVEFLFELLVSDSPLSPSRIAAIDNWSAHFLVDYMGLSGREEHVDVLIHAIAKDHHFVGQRPLLRALERLGVQLSDVEHSASRSLSIWHRAGAIFINEDDKYQGGSNCAACRFFPCRVNRAYTGGIEDCKLWGKEDPGHFDEIFDHRTWGDSLATAPAGIERLRDPERLLAKADALIGAEQVQAAIPMLCDALLIDFAQPLAWLLLARCTHALDEPGLSVLCMAEAKRHSRLLERDRVEARQELEAFAANHERIVARTRKLDTDARLDLAMAYKRSPAVLLRCYDAHIDYSIQVQGRAGSAWYMLARCHEKLGELAIAELFMRMSFAVDTSSDTKRRPLAETLHERRAAVDDPGIDRVARASARRADS